MRRSNGKGGERGIGGWRRWAGMAALALGLAGIGARGVEARESSASLAHRAEVEIQHDDQLRERNIDVTANATNDITLKGTVRSDTERARAQRLARVPGVRWVHNDLTVDDGRGRAVPAAPPSEQKRVDVGTEVNKAGDKVGRALDEEWLSTKVKAQLMTDEKMAGSSDIKVSSENNVVRLEGVVPSEMAKARALEIARTTKGVEGVEDRLVVMQKR